MGSVLLSSGSMPSPRLPGVGDVVSIGGPTRLLVVDVLTPALDPVPGCGLVVCAWVSRSGKLCEAQFTARALQLVRRRSPSRWG